MVRGCGKLEGGFCKEFTEGLAASSCTEYKNRSPTHRGDGEGICEAREEPKEESTNTTVDRMTRVSD